jgi:hypothetical protein
VLWVFKPRWARSRRPRRAVAFVAAERRPPSLEVVTLDERLAGAARKEGFVLIGGLVPESRRALG